MKKTNKGVGISMNLVDSGGDYQLNMTVTGYNDPGTVYGTYQHSNRNISLATSKSYSFSTSIYNGLGGVLLHTYPSYFDGMKGVKAL